MRRPSGRVLAEIQRSHDNTNFLHAFDNMVLMSKMLSIDRTTSQPTIQPSINQSIN